MDDYISRPYIMGKLTAADAQKAVREMSGDEAYNWFLELVGFAPAADVEPVRHGRWVDFTNAACRCSVCGAILAAHSYYCPNCGAKMDGGAEDG